MASYHSIVLRESYKTPIENHITEAGRVGSSIALPESCDLSNYATKCMLWKSLSLEAERKSVLSCWINLSNMQMSV